MDENLFSCGGAGEEDKGFVISREEFKNFRICFFHFYLIATSKYHLYGWIKGLVKDD